MTSIGTTKNPAVGRVQTEERAFEVLAFCQDRGIQLVIEVAPDQPEDISDVDRALAARQPVVAVPKIGRNDPCLCGSGRKFKKCCERRQPQTGS
jgi:SWIM/SEC-C metal-binding protein